jgi:hypothetical protein
VLLSCWLDIVAEWRSAFPQTRTWRLAVGQGLGTLVAFGRRTLSRALCALGLQHQDWTSAYRLHARSDWNPNALFQPIIRRALPWCKGRYVALAIDDTRIRKTGRKIPTVAYHRDPMSPKFHVNLMLGLRFLQVGLLVPLYRHDKAAPRSLPVRFDEVPPVKRPRRKATQEDWDAYRAASKQHNLSTRSVEIIKGLRTSVDDAGRSGKKLLIVGDNSFCNHTLFTAAFERTEIIARARRDLRLCLPAPAGSHRVYDAVKFTPQEILQDAQKAWQKVRVFYAGNWRKMRYKEVRGVLWQNGARQRPLRLFVIAPIPYHVPGRKRPHQRDAAFLLTTDLNGSARELLQPYFDRWQIEVNHREEKDTLGIGQAQLRSAKSVPRQPAFAVASYSAVLLAALQCFGVHRDRHFEPLPKWRRNATRPSCLDLVTLLRKEIAENPDMVQPYGFKFSWKSLGLAAAA